MGLFDSIGRRLRDEREKLGLNQSQIADVVAAAGVTGATRQSQSLYEKGKRMPDAAYLAVIAQIGFDVGYILTGSRSDNPAGAISGGREKALLDNYRACEEEDRRAIERVALNAAASKQQERQHAS